jgi:hypothetical protein
MNDLETLRNIDKKLSALIALVSINLGDEEMRTNTKIEVVLHNSGLDNSEIAKITGKKLAAIQKALQRAKK